MLPHLLFPAASLAASAFFAARRAGAVDLDVSANTPVWDDDASWAPLPPLAADVSCDVVVVGLGGSGLTAALALALRGLRVVGLDARDVAGGAAGRNGGLLLAGAADFYHDHAARVGRAAARALYARTLAELDALFAAHAPPLARRTGSLRLAADAAEEADCRAQLAAMAADGLPVEWYDGPEGRGLLFPRDGVVQPLARARALARAALAAGARLFGATRVARVARDGVVAQGGARVRARRVIVAVDGGLDEILPQLAPRVRTVRLQMLATAPDGARARAAAAGGGGGGARPVYTRGGFDYWQTLADGRVACGGLRDTDAAAEETREGAPSARIQARLDALVRAAPLASAARVTHRWAASVAFTASGDPVCEELAEGAAAGVFALGGYCGTGNVIGAMCGREAAAWAVRTMPEEGAQ